MSQIIPMDFLARLRTVILMLLLMSSSMNLLSQDILVKKDGSTILAKVIEVGQNEIKFIKTSNPKGPTYTISVSDLLAINYENGEKDSFATNTQQIIMPSNSQVAGPLYIEKAADEGNNRLLSMYNRIYKAGKSIKAKDKISNVWYSIYGATSNSILSNQDLEISFQREVYRHKRSWKHDGDYDAVRYNIVLKNKTNRPIYIDKGNCFRNDHCYYDGTEQISTGTSRGGGVSLGLGSVASVMGVGGAVGTIASGVGIGGGSSSSFTRTYNLQRIITIGPNASRNLCQEQQIKNEGYTEGFFHVNDWDLFDEAERYSTVDEDFIKSHNLKCGESILLTEDESPIKYNYTITYSTDPSFNSYSTMSVTLYVKQILCNHFGFHVSDSWVKLKNVAKYIEGVDEYTVFW